MDKNNLDLDCFLACQWDLIAKDIDKMNDYQRSEYLDELTRGGDSLQVIEVMTLLHRVSSMVLDPSSINSPYRSLYGNDKKNTGSFLSNAFNSDELVFFKLILNTFDDPWLKARLNDILWLCDKPRNPEYARFAACLYTHNEISSDLWQINQSKYWERAIRLCLQLKDAQNLDVIEDLIYSELFKEHKDKKYMNLWLSKLLLKLNIARDKNEKIAKRLYSISLVLKEQQDYYASRLYLEVVESIYLKDKNQSDAWLDCLISMAECYELEATIRMDSSQISANTFVEKAIQAYRRIPIKFRGNYGIEAKLSSLRYQLSKSGKASLNEMGLIKSESVDIKELIVSSKEHVRNKESLELSLLYFVGVSSIIDYSSLKEETIKILSEFSISSMFGSIYKGPDGRVIAKTPPLSSKNDDSYKQNLHSQMIRNFRIGISFSCKGQILPALDEILTEHCITRDFLESLCLQSPIVPLGREKLMAMALWLGFEYDFSNAVHLLCPQLENIVRVALKEVGAHTSNVDRDGIENENGLSTLMELELINDVFGKDLAFEIKAVFTDSLGGNLRNEVAHGLLNDQSANSIEAIYGWWLTLRIIMHSLVHE